MACCLARRQRAPQRASTGVDLLDDLLREQLVAVCQTARSFPTSVMFPMVSTLGELLDARQILADAAGAAGPPDDDR